MTRYLMLCYYYDKKWQKTEDETWTGTRQQLRDLGHGGRHLRGQRHDGGEPLPQRPDAARVARLPGEDEIFSIDIFWPRPALPGAARPGGLVALQQGGDVLPGAGGGAGRHPVTAAAPHTPARTSPYHVIMNGVIGIGMS